MKKFPLIILLMACIALFTACGGGGSAPAPAPAAPTEASAYAFGATAPSSTAADALAPQMAALGEALNSKGLENDGLETNGLETGGLETGGFETGGLSQVDEARKVVYSAEYRLETDDFNGTMQRLEQKIALSGSYIQQSDSRAATEHSPAYASLNIRVPAAMYGDFNTFLNNLATPISSNSHGEDVTAQYFDTEARLKVLQAQEARILTFIANSKNLEEIFAIERELTRISIEIEQLTTVRNRLDNLIAYATIYVEIYETREDDEAEDEQTAFSLRVQDAMEGSLQALITFAQGMVLILIWMWPLLIVVALAWLLWRKRFKKHNPAPKPPLPPKDEE